MWRSLVALCVMFVVIIGNGHSQQAAGPCLEVPESLWISNPAAAGERVAGYVKRLSTVKEPALSTCVNRLLEKAYADSTTRVYLSDELEALLFNTASPLRNDSLYMVFLKATLASRLVPEAEKSRYRFQLENVRKNMPGSKAVDFELLDKKGGRFKMSDIKSDYLVLFFYDPDCVRCQKTEQRLMADPLLKMPGVKVLAVYPGIRTREWLDAPSFLPDSWTDGCSPQGEVNTRLLYFIQSMPSIYLLDKDKRVVLKDVSAHRLHDYLSNICYQN